MVSAHKIRSFPRQKREKICSFAVKSDTARTNVEAKKEQNAFPRSAPFCFFKISLLKERQTQKNLRP